MNLLFRLVEGLMYLMWEGVYIVFSGMLRAVITILVIIYSLFSGHHF